MKVLSILGSVVLVALAAGSAGASDAYSQTAAERYIKDSEAAWAASVATNDSSVVQRILADDCVWVLEGEVVDKPRAVSDAQHNA
jgi:hypothetical protein